MSKITPIVITLLLGALTPFAALNGALYYVDHGNPSASDNNSGTEDSPWLTIQHAVDHAKAGDTIIVKPGNYARTSIRKGGNKADGWITIMGIAAPDTSHIPFSELFDPDNPVHTPGNPTKNAVSKGFVITPRYGDTIPVTHIRIRNFEITAVHEANQPFSNRAGIYLANTKNIEIADNLFHDINGPNHSSQGIFALEASCNHEVIIHRNRFFRVQGISIMANGTNWVLEDNRISNGISHRTDTGDIVTGDVDAIRFHGTGHLIRGNWIHDFLDQEQGGNKPHMDAFQTYSNNGTSAHNVRIERNWVQNLHQMVSMSDFWERDKGEDLIHSITFVNNMSIGMTSCALDIYDYCNLFTLENNTFAFGRLSVGNGFPSRFLEGMVFRNNILYKRSTTQISLDTAVAFWDYNLHYPDFGYPPRVPGYDENSFFGEDPLFVNPDDPLGPDGLPFTSDDGLRLSAQSPASGSGFQGADMGIYPYVYRRPPTGLTANITTSRKVILLWTAPGYQSESTHFSIHRDGVHIGTSTLTSYEDTLVIPSTSYTYTVYSHDSHGHASVSSAPAVVTTQAAGTNQPPVLAPIGPKSTPAGQTLQFQVDATDPDDDALTWSATGDS